MGKASSGPAIQLGFSAWPGWFPWQVTKEAGLFDKAGVKVDLVWFEGYTDSLGSPDYNLDLSQRRADSVKEYLVNVMGINPAQVETRGYGASKFLVAPRPVIANSPEEQMEIERQRPNRRVVIVVHTDAR